jgi:uncharacterized protein YdhG (YjbR/CyaY superfamily)
VNSEATTVEEYISQLPPDRREAVSALRSVILRTLPAGYEEGLQWRMISYSVPLSRSGPTYNGQPLSYVALASQKNYLSLYLMAVYGPREQGFRERYAATGKRLNMGKSCVRFRRLEDLPLDLIGQEIASVPVETFLAVHERARSR